MQIVNNSISVFTTTWNISQCIHLSMVHLCMGGRGRAWEGRGRRGEEEMGMGRRWAWEGDGHGKEMGMGRKSWAWEGRDGHGHGQVKVGHGKEGWYEEEKVGREVWHGNQQRRMFQTRCGIEGGMEKKKGNMVIK